MTTGAQPIVVDTIPLCHATVEEYCRALQQTSHCAFWWYLGRSKVFGDFSIPFQAGDGSWWYQVKPGFCWPADVLAVRGTLPRLPLRKAFLGYQCIAQESIANARQTINIISDVSAYGICSIDAKRRNAIRKGLRCCRVEKIQVLTPEIVVQCTAVWNEFVQRSGWKAPVSREWVEKTWEEVLRLPGATILLGIDSKSGKIVGFLITKVLGSTAYVDTIASHSAGLNVNVNDLLIYSFIASAKEIETVKNVHYAIKSYDGKLESFKCSVGFRPESLPSRTHLRPGVGLLLRACRPKDYSRLMGDICSFTGMNRDHSGTSTIRVVGRFSKRSFDVFVSSVGLLILLLPFGLIAAAVKLSSRGPIFFTQDRVGRCGKIFRCVKFRTMYMSAQSSGHITTDGDSRVTPFGRFLRRCKLDELPQLWNVLTGTMSFVGPRPDVPGYADELKGKSRRLLAVLPGITSPASLYFRYEEQVLAQVVDPKHYNDTVIWPKKVELNLAYADSWTFWKDFEYILVTIIPKLNVWLKLFETPPSTPEAVVGSRQYALKKVRTH